MPRSSRRRLAEHEQLLNKHVLPSLGALELRAITPGTIARWQAERLAAGYGRVSVRYALTLLGAILQRAFENGRPIEPGARGPQGLAAATEGVRRLAAGDDRTDARGEPPRDAALVSVLAYAGLRPGEALALQWRDIREQTILVERAISLGEEKDTKTAAHRTVRLLQPLANDLKEWRPKRSPRDDGAHLPLGGRHAMESGCLPVMASPGLHTSNRGGGDGARPPV